ncbi:MAG TPA: alpha/beta hydrolase [Burkholderiales bacterium]
MPFVSVQGHRLEYDVVRVASADAPTIVFLHEGLGSLAMWKDFPERVARATHCHALVYSRHGYGRSDPLTGARDVGFMHDEALQALPEFLDKLGVDRPILFGHSDGASIALIHAGGGTRPVRALILMAPHVLVEDITIESIVAAKRTYETTDLPAKLGRYHANVDSAFWGWNDVWLNPEFRAWNIEAFLPRIACPILVIQGESDEYGTMDQIARIERAAVDVETLKLPNCAHSPQRDKPDEVIAAAVAFIDRLREASAAAPGG